jgi:hypothetical protein
MSRAVVGRQRARRRPDRSISAINDRALICSTSLLPAALQRFGEEATPVALVELEARRAQHRRRFRATLRLSPGVERD